jgi:hypothetical protein
MESAAPHVIAEPCEIHGKLGWVSHGVDCHSVDGHGADLGCFPAVALGHGSQRSSHDARLSPGLLSQGISVWVCAF